MEGHGHFRVKLQNFRQELVRELRRQNLQVGGRAPILAHAEQPGLAEVKAVGGNKVLCAKPRLCNIPPGEAERLPAPRMHLAVKQGQTRPPVHRLGGHAQPLKVAHNVRLHALQPGPRLVQTFRRDAKGNIF